ncbi:hypothetical protein J1605_015307 [Eschrichtius robustus]|uniref:Uncharacterized protein n=1 Tax=Eschrichtius robustus TaxID=9764 RepID=A0AB34GA62_ESCRO|nr:hypothetical protein J1605_015307 [Eschrichtius robustus]
MAPPSPACLAISNPATCFQPWAQNPRRPAAKPAFLRGAAGPPRRPQPAAARCYLGPAALIPALSFFPGPLEIGRLALDYGCYRGPLCAEGPKSPNSAPPRSVVAELGEQASQDEREKLCHPAVPEGDKEPDLAAVATGPGHPGVGPGGGPAPRGCRGPGVLEDLPPPQCWTRGGGQWRRAGGQWRRPCARLPALRVGGMDSRRRASCDRSRPPPPPPGISTLLAARRD